MSSLQAAWLLITYGFYATLFLSVAVILFTPIFWGLQPLLRWWYWQKCRRPALLARLPNAEGRRLAMQALADADQMSRNWVADRRGHVAPHASPLLSDEQMEKGIRNAIDTTHLLDAIRHGEAYWVDGFWRLPCQVAYFLLFYMWGIIFIVGVCMQITYIIPHH